MRRSCLIWRNTIFSSYSALYLQQDSKQNTRIVLGHISPSTPPLINTKTLYTSTIMAPSNKNPSHGQKVDLGRKAPTTHEGVGSVESGSLAAESAAFKSSNEMSSSDFSSSNRPQEGAGFSGGGSGNRQRTSGAKGGISSSGSGSTTTQARDNTTGKITADTHHHTEQHQQKSSFGLGSQQQSQQQKSQSTQTSSGSSGGRHRMSGGGPHGKNLHEDNNLTGENASFTQYGTEADPAYLAERKFEAMDSMPAASTGGAGREKKIDDKNIYDALGSESNA
jgi:hypothetical protein